MKHLPLKDKQIVITRPKHQASHLAENIQKGGGCTILFPLIEITPLDTKEAIQQLQSLSQYDVVIFISVNAVTACINLIGIEPLNDKVLVTVGKKSAAALKAHNLTVKFCPDNGFNSEALLQIDAFTKVVPNKKVVIIRGSAGRDYLKNNLTTLGATVDYIDVYKRHCPQENLKALVEAHYNKKIDAILLTSASSTAHFFELARHENWINETNILLGSARMQHEIPRGFKGNILIADDPSDETLLDRLIVEYG